MRIKLLGLAVVAALALTASVGAGSAFADVTVESCKEELVGCQPASIGTTFKAKSTNVILEGLINNTCTMDIEGEVTDNEATAGPPSDSAEALIVEASFTSCNVTTATPENLPWTLSMDSAEFPAGKVSGAAVELGIGSPPCKFAENSTHRVTGTWVNGMTSGVTLGGSMARVAGNFIPCGNEGGINGTVAITEVADPGYAEADNIVIE